MRILGIESSCDETAAAIIEAESGAQSVSLIASTVASSLSLHGQTGGIIPEIAAREQVRFILPVLQETITKAGLSLTNPDIDAIAVTYGPGLIGSLLVGVETARTLGYLWNKPLIPVNHMLGHIYANWIKTPGIEEKQIEFPVLALVVSGGHTDLILIKNHEEYQVVGGTRDDAAGEAFDKIGRLLGLPYPGGPAIEKAAKLGNPKLTRFPRPLVDSGDFDFSFSGLKTAVLREIQKRAQLTEEDVNNLSASVLEAIIDVLTRKTLHAAETYEVKTLILSGGVAANQTLKEAFEKKIAAKHPTLSFSVPPRNLCTDNAAMVATAGFYNHQPTRWQNVTVNPELYY